MKLSIRNRLILLNLLPKETSYNYITYKVLNTLRMDLSFSDKEIKEYDIKIVDNRVHWNMVKEKPKEVEIGETAQAIIATALTELDKQGKISEENADLYEWFVLKENKG